MRETYKNVGPLGLAVFCLLVTVLLPIKFFGDIFLDQQMMKVVEWGLFGCLVCGLLCVPSLVPSRSGVERS